MVELLWNKDYLSLIRIKTARSFGPRLQLTKKNLAT